MTYQPLIFLNNSHITSIVTSAGTFPLFLRNLFPSQVAGESKSIAHVLLPPFGGLEEEKEEHCEPLVVSLCLTACLWRVLYVSLKHKPGVDVML